MIRTKNLRSIGLNIACHTMKLRGSKRWDVGRASFTDLEDKFESMSCSIIEYEALVRQLKVYNAYRYGQHNADENARIIWNCVLILYANKEHGKASAAEIWYAASLKKKRSEQESSSSSNVIAMIVTCVFGLVIIVHGLYI